ncbi:hypothetical protein EV426DRAFT_536906, partial [Tirmania nivea]
ADINIVYGEYGTALGMDAYLGNEHIVSLLLDQEADVNHMGGKYATALWRSCVQGNFFFFFFFLKSIRRFDLRSCDGVQGN